MNAARSVEGELAWRGARDNRHPRMPSPFRKLTTPPSPPTPGQRSRTDKGSPPRCVCHHHPHPSPVHRVPYLLHILVMATQRHPQLSRDPFGDDADEPVGKRAGSEWRLSEEPHSPLLLKALVVCGVVATLFGGAGLFLMAHEVETGIDVANRLGIVVPAGLAAEAEAGFKAGQVCAHTRGGEALHVPRPFAPGLG